MARSSEINKLKSIERRLLKETERIEESEEKIEKEEKKISHIETDIIKSIKKQPVRALMKNGFTQKELGYLHKLLVYKIARHRYIFTLLITLGIVLIWRGFWEITETLPLLSYPIIALLSGILIIWLTERITHIN